MKLKLKLLLAMVAMLTAPLAGWCQPTQVFIVRHAEKAAEPKDDPAISAVGVARAETLAQVLAATNIRTILTTQYLRTQQTAAPTAKQFGLTPKVLTIQRGQAQAHIAEVVAEVRKSTGPVLVVGHSNTVAGIVAGLSSSKPVTLCETSFANLFVVTLQQPELPAVQLKYGKPDVAPEPDCQ
ncbi:histidine phosphatase family protein [Duganella fentianensis]|uniref:SixA phosphatase family protein n=1 Tax=Duganella fentianensis TaxID=2692177 RepID=UPI0032B25C1C